MVDAPFCVICVRREAPVCVICVSLFESVQVAMPAFPIFHLLPRKESVFDGERPALAIHYSLRKATDGGTRDARSAGT